MNPSDTQIERMSDLFAAKLRSDKKAWKAALDYARTTGSLETLEAAMSDEADDETSAAWNKARSY